MTTLMGRRRCHAATASRSRRSCRPLSRRRMAASSTTSEVVVTAVPLARGPLYTRRSARSGSGHEAHRAASDDGEGRLGVRLADLVSHVVVAALAQVPRTPHLEIPTRSLADQPKLANSPTQLPVTLLGNHRPFALSRSGHCSPVFRSFGRSLSLYRHAATALGNQQAFRGDHHPRPRFVSTKSSTKIQRRTNGSARIARIAQRGMQQQIWVGVGPS
ncbi:hypothetical protein TRIUR3_19843 [Triticum urartu]|uniref:Uncharacterized protein n=1 Tax=Triticum urartu TaxID=4572 RepID=M8AWA7_TRIUA|nr:hypothetical protein TRIUR3_19843 [Triticum urartu]